MYYLVFLLKSKDFSLTILDPTFHYSTLLFLECLSSFLAFPFLLAVLLLFHSSEAGSLGAWLTPSSPSQLYQAQHQGQRNGHISCVTHQLCALSPCLGMILSFVKQRRQYFLTGSLQGVMRPFLREHLPLCWHRKSDDFLDAHSIQPIFTKHLLYARHCSGFCRYISEQASPRYLSL